MSALSYRMLVRKGGTTSAIIAVALLVAILASMNSIVNYINLQTDVLGEYVNVGGAFLVLSRNSTSETDSKIDAELSSLLNNITDIKYTLPQRVLTANLITDSGNHKILMRGVENVTSFLNLRRAYVKGTSAKAYAEANVGEILARIASVDLGGKVNVTVDSATFAVKVVGLVKTITYNDAELLVPMETIHNLTRNDGKISTIEFTLKENVEKEAILNITQLLPTDVKVVRTQQLKEFMQDVNWQTLNFLNLWSVAVYAVVAAASYVIATRLIVESSYELAMLRALGAKKKFFFTLVLTYAAAITLLGSFLGLALGTAGTQVASTIFGWILTTIEVNPFLEPTQALQTLLLALASSTIGCLYPALKRARKSCMEQPL